MQFLPLQPGLGLAPALANFSGAATDNTEVKYSIFQRKGNLSNISEVDKGLVTQELEVEKYFDNTKVASTRKFSKENSIQILMTFLVQLILLATASKKIGVQGAWWDSKPSFPACP